MTVSLRQLRKLKTKASGLPSPPPEEEIGYLLDAHLEMLRIRVSCAASAAHRQQRINAERAVESKIGEVAESFAAMRDAYLAARVEDIRVVGARLVRNLIKTPYAPI